MNNITCRLAWRNLWRRKRRTWLTVGAMVFSNIILVFLISLQIGMYGMMINNTLKAQTGHLQVQAPGYKDDHKMRQVVPNVQGLAERLRSGLGLVAVFSKQEHLRQVLHLTLTRSQSQTRQQRNCTSLLRTQQATQAHRVAQTTRSLRAWLFIRHHMPLVA